MFLIINEGQLVGYTYDKIALLTLFKLNKESNHPMPLSFKEVSDDVVTKNVEVKTKEHIQNLVIWYSRNGYSHYYWHYIVYNRELIKKFSTSYQYFFHKTYYELFIQSIMEDLSELMNEYSIPYECGETEIYDKPGYFAGKPISARAKRNECFKKSRGR